MTPSPALIQDPPFLSPHNSTHKVIIIMLSEKKAINFLKPWWDVAYQATVLALIILALLMLFVSSGFVQDRYGNLSQKIDELKQDASESKSSKKDGQIDLVVRSRFTATDNENNLTKINVDHHSNIVQEIVKESTSRTKRSLMPTINISLINSKIQESSQDVNEIKDNFNPLYSIVLLSIIYLLESGFNKVFYSDHLMQSLVHLISTLSDVREFRKMNHGLIFANTLHHAQNRRFLWTLFWMKNLVRLIMVIIALSVTAHFHLSADVTTSSSLNQGKQISCCQCCLGSIS